MGTFWEQRGRFQISTLARSCVRYTGEVKGLGTCWEQRWRFQIFTLGRRYFRYTGEVKALGTFYRNRMQVPYMYTCQEMWQVHM